MHLLVIPKQFERVTECTKRWVKLSDTRVSRIKSIKWAKKLNGWKKDELVIEKRKKAGEWLQWVKGIKWFDDSLKQ
jgi:hypothetical protein